MESRNTQISPLVEEMDKVLDSKEWVFTAASQFLLERHANTVVELVVALCWLGRLSAELGSGFD